jgi:hypothetical protein
MDIDDIIRRSETVIGLLEEQRASLNQLKNKESKLPSYLGETEEQIQVQDKDNNASFETKDIEIAVSESEHHIYIEAWAKLPSGDRIYKFNQTIERKIFNKEKSNEQNK